jgi:uncharacterized protein YbcI
MSDLASSRPSARELNAAVARAIVRVHRSTAGRGPTKGQAFFHNNVLVVVLEDAMTVSERTLAADGRHEAARRARDELHSAMKPQMIAAIEELTGRTVLACLGDSQTEPDVVAEVFLLDGPVAADPLA